jgi:predicted MPP superfamily phosphohydrolase
MIGGRRRVLSFGDASIELIGLPGYLRIKLPPDFADSMPPPPDAKSGMIRIVLSHFPDHLRRTETLQPHLFLAGHTHGGQVCLPGRIPIIKHDKLPRRWCSGIHRVGETWLVVNRGFGAGNPQVRLFCPPEVIEIELV